jgi:sucrose-6-phosphate hydrolase SacC (GH32 family)
MPATALVWEKQGLIFRPDPTRPWMRTHAAVPTPLQLDGSLYRIYFSGRDEGHHSHVGYFDLDLNEPRRILAISPDAILAPGALGCYDADGIYAESVIRRDGQVWLYTIGVTTGHTSPLFYAAIGIAKSADGGTTFEKFTAAPIMQRSGIDPCLVTAPFVLRDRDRWRMWYVSCERWTHEAHGLQSHYFVKYAESDDGVEWRREGRVAIALSDGETNIARLWVVPDEGRYRAWYSVGGGKRGYRIGYAESADGLDWTRLDDRAGIALSPDGWDSEAQAYPAVVKHDGRWFMFYNGNKFGRDGIGLAIAQA